MKLLKHRQLKKKYEPIQFSQHLQSHVGVYWYLPALICCFEADAPSCRESSPAICLKTTGARDIVPGVVTYVGGSRRLAYNERPPFAGLFKLSGAIQKSGIGHVVAEQHKYL